MKVRFFVVALAALTSTIVAFAQGDPELDEMHAGGAPVEPITVGAGRSVVHFESAGSRLEGYVYRPPGKGPFPILVWSHSGESRPGAAGRLAEFVMSNGYAVFEPIRRGVGRSQGVSMSDALKSVRGEERKRRFVTALEQERLDVDQAVGVARNFTFTDKRNIYVAGCGSGAALALLEAESNAAVRGAIVMSPAVKVWDENPYLRERLKQAARAKRVPILLLQARSEPSLGPSRVLGPLVETAGQPSRSKVYGRLGPNYCLQATGAWGPDVLDFLKRSRVR